MEVDSKGHTLSAINELHSMCMWLESSICHEVPNVTPNIIPKGNISNNIKATRPVFTQIRLRSQQQETSDSS